MIKPIVKDVFFLGQKAEDATKQDLSVGQNLQDTLQANRDRCVGMAANMIGVRKKDACPWKESEKRPVIRISKWNIWTAAGRNIGINLPDGRLRSFSMKLTICRG